MKKEEFNKIVANDYMADNKPRLTEQVASMRDSHHGLRIHLMPPKKLKDFTGEVTGNAGVLCYLGVKNDRHMWLTYCFNCHEVSANCGDYLKYKNSSSGLRCHKCSSLKHGFSDTFLYKLWMRLISKCENPKDSCYRYFGKKGYKVSKRWKDYNVFFTDMGAEHSTDKVIKIKDGCKIFNKANCFWGEKTRGRKPNAERLVFK